MPSNIKSLNKQTCELSSLLNRPNFNPQMIYHRIWQKFSYFLKIDLVFFKEGWILIKMSYQQSIIKMNLLSFFHFHSDEGETEE